MKDEMVGISDVLILKEVRYVCGIAIVSMVGTNFYDSKFIKGDSAPGPNEIGPGTVVRFLPVYPKRIKRSKTDHG